MTFNPSEHVIVMERKSKKKDAQGRDTWEVTKTEYLPVQWRLYWFRLENQKGKIDSKAFTIDLEKGAAIFETYVEREDGGSARMHGSETQGDWRDYIEKAQTKSLGRALAAVGYGSQFTDDEFAEGERIVDSPVARPAPPPAKVPTWEEVYRRGIEKGTWKRETFYATASALLDMPVHKENVKTLDASQLIKLNQAIDTEPVAQAS